MTRTLLVGSTAALFALIGAPAMAQTGMGSSASISVATGPHAGKYAFAPREACVIAAFTDQPLGLSVVMSSENSSLSLDMPSLDEKHANEIQIVLVVADKRAGATMKGTASTTYEIDTRPDTALKPYQKAERANKGITGKAKTTLMTQGSNVLLSFSGETATGVKIEGEVTC
ncbi:MAG TPA: hypothetical protein VFS58_08930, partial [Steroidobacteraceae bacterium]|nr:hypothetical protein [Steroidobacteraceae bacterium]